METIAEVGKKYLVWIKCGDCLNLASSSYNTTQRLVESKVLFINDSFDQLTIFHRIDDRAKKMSYCVWDEVNVYDSVVFCEVNDDFEKIFRKDKLKKLG